MTAEPGTCLVRGGLDMLIRLRVSTGGRLAMLAPVRPTDYCPRSEPGGESAQP
jgi:hypothetical protein